MAKTYEKEKLRITQARMRLLADYPFWGDLAFGFPILWDETLDPPTAATDGTKIIFHPEFVNSLSLEELVFVMAHEVMHPALMHILRRGNRCPKRWNVACDVVVNSLLVGNLVGKMPSFGVYEPNLYAKANGKVEDIYDLLPDNKEYGEPGSGGTNASMDAIIDADPAQKDNLAADMRNKLQQALQTAKQAGKLPGDLEQFIDSITAPKVSWQDHVRNFIMTTRGGERTWAKRNRRHASTGIMLPGAYGETTGEIGVGVDCSGSTSDEMVSQFGSEIASIQEEVRPEKVHVLYFDTDVKKHEEYEPDEPLTMKAYGRGGTCFRTVFEYIEKNNINIESLIIMTDLDCYDYGPKPPYPVLWLGVGPYAKQLAANVPWGQVVLID